MDSLYSLREVQEIVALTTAADWQIIGDAIPQDVWDDLHERGLVTTTQDITGDYDTGSTALGIDYVVARIRPNEADHDNA